MPKALNRNEELPAPFLRQRRNLLLTSVFLIYVSLFVEKIESVEFAPIKVKHFWGDNNITWVLWLGLVVLAYFAIRAWQRMDVEDIWITPEAIAKLCHAIADGVSFDSDQVPTGIVYNSEIKRYQFAIGNKIIPANIKTNYNSLTSLTDTCFGEFYGGIINKLKLSTLWSSKEQIAAHCLLNSDFIKNNGYQDYIRHDREVPVEVAFTKEFLHTASLYAFRGGDFLKHPYLSDYLFPFFLASFAFCCVLVRLIMDWSGWAVFC